MLIVILTKWFRLIVFKSHVEYMIIVNSFDVFGWWEFEFHLIAFMMLNFDFIYFL